MPPGPTAVLARFAAGLRFEALPDDVVAQARRCLLDALGCCLFGVTLPWTRKLIDLVADEGGRPQAGIPGTALRTSASQAALVGGTAGHGFELDDIHAAAHLHAGSLAVPVVLALAEAQGRESGRELLAAVVAGYEVGLRVGLAATGSLFLRGHHFQGTCGVFVAAAAAARISGLDADATRHALGIAGSQAGGLMAAQEGAMVKRLHAGKAAQAGVLAAGLARRGFTGIVNVLEAPYGGFLGTFSDRPDPDRLTEGLGRRWEILEVGFKRYATAASIQAPLDALDRLMRAHGLAADDLEEIEVHCSSMAHRHCAWPYRPTGVTAAQMNMPFALAMMAVDRAATTDQFRDERLSDPRVLAVLRRIRVSVDPDYDRGGDRTRHAARVAVRTAGTRLEADAPHRPGSPADPLSDGEIEAKFRTLAGHALPRPNIDRLIELVGRIEAGGVSELHALFAAVRPSA